MALNSFSHLSTLSLPTAHRLPASALNPRMDVLALVRVDPPPVKRAGFGMGMGMGMGAGGGPWAARTDQRERELGARGRSGVGLWRVESTEVHGQGWGGVGAGGSGAVWEVALGGGDVLDLAWSPDGQVLSVLLRGQTPPHTLRLVHLSVHDGATLHAFDLPAGFGGSTPAPRMRWYRTVPPVPSDPEPHRDAAGESAWPAPEKASGAMIADSIPRPSRVEAFVSLAQEQMNIPAVSGGAAASMASPGLPTVHLALEDFPGGLPATPPHILHITWTGGPELSLLAGGFPLPPRCIALAPPPPPPTPVRPSTLPRPIPVPPAYPAAGYALDPPLCRPPTPVLRMAEHTRGVRDALDIILRGIEGCERTYREGVSKPAMMWREELESEGKRHGANFEATYADLTRLLLIGKAGTAVSRYMGGLLTNNGLGSWAKLHAKAIARMHRLLTHSVFPACERLLMYLEDMASWATCADTFGLHLPAADVDSCIAWVQYLASQAMELDRELKEEEKRFREFVKWCLFEISKNTTATDAEEEAPLVSTHDVMAVCDYLDVGFLHSKVERFFLTMDELLDYAWAPPRLPRPRTTRPLHVVLQASLSALRSNTPSPIINSPRERHIATTSTMLLSPRDDTRSYFEPVSGGGERTRGADGEPAAAQKTQPTQSVTLWAIADVVRQKIQALVSSSIKPYAATSEATLPLLNSDAAGPLSDVLRLDDKTALLATVGEDLASVRLARFNTEGPGATTIAVRCFALEQTKTPIRILALAFFDTEELALVVEKRGARRLVTISLASVEYDGRVAFSSLATPLQTELTRAEAHTTTIAFARSRLLKKALPMRADEEERISLAANGRKSRRIAVVTMGDGREMDAFDIGVDDDDDEQDADMTGDNTAEASGYLDNTGEEAAAVEDVSAMSMEME